MYNALFGLTKDPFSIAPDPRFLYMSERHREALAHLLYGAQGGGGLVLLTGAVGAGKTTVCRAFVEQLPKSVDLAYVFNPALSVTELLAVVSDDFGLAVPAQASVKAHVDALNDFLLQRHAQGRSCVLVIDEAQNLSSEVLEQLRLLTNLETDTRKLLQIVLIGQPELRDRLAGPALEQVAQRVIARYHLEPLSEADTLMYVRHRMAVAGLVTALPFDDPALRRVHKLARGVPRRINLLCDRALLGAYARQRTGHPGDGRAGGARGLRRSGRGDARGVQPPAPLAGWHARTGPGGHAGGTVVGTAAARHRGGGRRADARGGRPGVDARPGQRGAGAGVAADRCRGPRVAPRLVRHPRRLARAGGPVGRGRGWRSRTGRRLRGSQHPGSELPPGARHAGVAASTRPADVAVAAAVGDGSVASVADGLGRQGCRVASARRAGPGESGYPDGPLDR
jgi:general secretion pathway protein A